MERIGRKRSSPVPAENQLSSCPPNRKIQKMDQKEKERLHRRAAEESRRSFQLQPHMAGWPASLLTSVGGPGGGTYDGKTPTGTPPFLYPSMTLVPSLISNSLSTPSRGTSLLTEVSNRSVGSSSLLSSPASSFQQRLHQPPPPSSTNRSQLLNRSTDSGNAQSEDETDGDKDSTTPTQETSYTPGAGAGGGSGVYPCLYSPRHIPSPFLYMYSHRSPISPMLFVGSPRAPPSIASIPSVESSSGCSSMSEGSSHPNGEGGRDEHTPGMRVAPDEYHVGVTIPPTDEPVTDDECVSSPSVNEDNEGSGENELIDVVGSQPSLLLPPPPPPLPPPSALPESNPSLSSIAPTNSSRPYGFENQNGYTNVIFHSSPAGALQTSSCVSSPSSSRGSSPEPTDSSRDDPRGGVMGGADETDDVFCLVPGRLSLLSATQKYKVSLDEVRRRLSGPECLNASVLGGILRRAKSKNGGHHLRQRLEGKGLSLPAGRRKQTELFLLTSLVEGEAVHLAEDFKRLCENHFPHSELAQIIGAQHVNSPHVERRISMVQAAQVLIQELQAMVDTVGGPNNLRPDDPCNPYPGLTNFSLLSHGFGNHNISSALSVIQSYFNELIGVYEGNKPTAMDSQLPPQQAPGAVYNNGATVIPPAAIYQVGGAGQANVRGKQPSRQKVMKREKKEGLACNGKP